MSKDLFSNQANTYAKYRPVYPKELFDHILRFVTEKNTAWDCATGNGQTAKQLSRHFEKVMATDISSSQLEKASRADNIYYSVQSAEQTNFPDNSFDLVTVSQALHWFRFDEFYAEVRRVARPGSWIAVWMYALLYISPEIDKLIHQYYTETLGKYWDQERRYVDENYSTLPFPFEEIQCPRFTINFDWTLEELEGYLHTWSALQKFITANGYNPADELIKQITPYWSEKISPDEENRRRIIFPVYVRMGRV